MTYLDRRNVQERPEDLLARAKKGDADARNQLILDYTPFVLKVASQKVGRYLRPESDEEVTVALLAFNEAIDAYDQERGSFISFSQTVIQRRLVDYFRQRQQRQHEVPLSDFERDDDGSHVETGPLEQAAKSAWQVREEEEARRQEIEEYARALRKYGIGWGDLVKAAPKHRDSRDRAIQLARAAVRRPEYQQGLLDRGEIPVQALVKEFGVSRRLIERHRKYILAVAVLLSHDLPYLQQYVLERG
ncbi:MAG: RNA polymerase sigma-I factor [Thermaerobacter sp.]|nr:RNA polymerase sigma-I factor [Thermaerobacter sp.]